MTSFEHEDLPRQPEDEGFAESIQDRLFTRNALEGKVRNGWRPSKQDTEKIVIPKELENKGILNPEQSTATQRAFDEAFGGDNA